jgi:hypothetical protein
MSEALYTIEPSYSFAGWVQLLRNGQVVHHYPTEEDARAAIIPEPVLGLPHYAYRTDKKGQP